MFIYNVKVSGTKVLKIFLISMIIFVIILCGIIGLKIYDASKVQDTDYKIQDVTELNNQNYANVLKMVHS